jgi:hypothetical protein
MNEPSDRLATFLAMTNPFVRHRVRLPDGRPLMWSVRLERDAAGHFTIEGEQFDGWCDGWPVNDHELGWLLQRGS